MPSINHSEYCNQWVTTKGSDSPEIGTRTLYQVRVTTRGGVT